MYEITVLATLQEIPTVIDRVDEILEELDCPMKAQMQIDVSMDEILSNIVNYGYAEKTGNIVVRVEELVGKVGVKLTFIDNGIQYNPLEKEDPDITLSADDRPIGGLGIYIVKKTMDSVAYSYENGCNIFTISKNF